MPRKHPKPTLTRSEVTTKVWRHNSFFGFSRMTESNMQSIIHSPTTTPAAKAIAQQIINECKQLTLALKERVDK